MHQKSDSRVKLLAMFALFAVLACKTAVAQSPQDIVYLTKKGGDGETKRNGEIVQWLGDVISLKSSSGVREINTDRLIRFETAWHPGYKQGEELLAAYRYDQAISEFNAALDSEDRQWMQNIVCAKLVQCYLAKEDFGNAAKYFLKLIADDPQSRFRHLAPLVWTSSRPKSSELRNAEGWLSSSEPMIAIMGASWLLSDRSRNDARKKMELFANDFEPTIAALAIAQLWRMDSVAADAKRLKIRIKKTQAMPEKVRCGAWYLIAEAQSKSKQEDQAIINFMRIPINDPQQGTLAAAALYQTAWLLDNAKQQGQAQVLRNELKEKFGDTVWAN